MAIERREGIIITVAAVIAVVAGTTLFTAATQKTVSRGSVSAVPVRAVSAAVPIQLYNNVAVATQNKDDLTLWFQSVPVRGLGGESGSFITREANSETLNELRLSRRIVFVESVTNANLLGEENGIAFIEVTEGIHKGLRGYITHSDILGNDETGGLRSLWTKPN